MRQARPFGDCPYCDRPARRSGACWIHEELLSGEPDAIARELEQRNEALLRAAERRQERRLPDRWP